MGFKEFIGQKIAERKQLKTIYKKTLFEEKKKFAGEKAIAKVKAIKAKAIERARTSPLQRAAKGSQKIAKVISALPLPRLRTDFNTGFDTPKRKKKSKRKGGGEIDIMGGFDLGF